MHGQLSNIIECLALCYALWGGFFIGLYRRGIDYSNRFLWTGSYFLAAAALLALIFFPYIAQVIVPFAAPPIIVLCVFMAAQALVYVYLPRVRAEPHGYFERYPDRYYLQLDWRRLISKSADLIFQQAFIVLFVMFLHDAGLSLYQVILGFGLLFALLHVPLIVREGGAWPSWYFAGAVVAFSIVFPPLILTVPYGFVYAYIIHWMFYTLAALVFWTGNASRGTPGR